MSICSSGVLPLSVHLSGSPGPSCCRNTFLLLLANEKQATDEKRRHVTKLIQRNLICSIRRVSFSHHQLSELLTRENCVCCNRSYVRNNSSHRGYTRAMTSRLTLRMWRQLISMCYLAAACAGAGSCNNIGGARYVRKGCWITVLTFGRILGIAVLRG